MWVGPATIEVRDSSFLQNYAGFGPSLAVDHGTFNGFNCDLDGAGNISGGAVVTMTCCYLGDLAGWNTTPIIANDGCVVSVTETSWGSLKSIFR